MVAPDAAETPVEASLTLTQPADTDDVAGPKLAAFSRSAVE
jgi:hypothetical protein